MFDTSEIELITFILSLGGCGAMFEINVIAPEFKGLNTVKQHRIINEVRMDNTIVRYLNITV